MGRMDHQAHEACTPKYRVKSGTQVHLHTLHTLSCSGCMTVHGNGRMVTNFLLVAFPVTDSCAEAHVKLHARCASSTFTPEQIRLSSYSAREQGDGSHQHSMACRAV